MLRPSSSRFEATAAHSVASSAASVTLLPPSVSLPLSCIVLHILLVLPPLLCLPSVNPLQLQERCGLPPRKVLVGGDPADAVVSSAVCTRPPSPPKSVTASWACTAPSSSTSNLQPPSPLASPVCFPPVRGAARCTIAFSPKDSQLQCRLCVDRKQVC